MTVTLDDMRAKLKTISDTEALLATTEPLGTVTASQSGKIKFNLSSEWNQGLDKIPDNSPVDAYVSVHGTEYQMTKEAVLQAGSLFGLTGAYASRTPGPLVAQHLDYWWGEGLGDKTYNLLTTGDTVAAFVRPTLVPFSNLDLLDQVLGGIRDKYGSDTEVLADFKFSHSLTQTDVRLIVPEISRDIVGGGLSDVPAGENDGWCYGVHLSNSLIGKVMTSVEAYLFRWWCANGATVTNEAAGTWSRRSDGQGEDVYVWARNATNEVLSEVKERFDAVQALTSVNVSGNTVDVLKEIFTTHGVPVTQRHEIMDALMESETLTLYSIMDAITKTANAPDLDPRRVDRMLRIGGSLPEATFDPVKAKVWSEGHESPKTAPNPYVIG